MLAMSAPPSSLALSEVKLRSERGSESIQPAHWLHQISQTSYYAMVSNVMKATANNVTYICAQEEYVIRESNSILRMVWAYLALAYPFIMIAVATYTCCFLRGVLKKLTRPKSKTQPVPTNKNPTDKNHTLKAYVHPDASPE